MININPPFDFATMIVALKFDASFDGAAFLVQQHLAFVQKMLTDFIHDGNSLSNEEHAAFASLPISSWLRIVTSPYICEILMVLNSEKPISICDRAALRIQLIQALVAEKTLTDSNYHHSLKPNWTINGDAVLNAEIAATFPSLQTECGIGLNYQSYVHNTGKAGVGGYSLEIALKHKERIDSALKIIAMVSPSAHSLIDNFTTMIQFRNIKHVPNVINSSTATSIGLIRTDNFHHIHSDMPEIVDMLVHESIHQYLHLYEEQVSPFVELTALPPELLEARVFASPWSGKPLDLRSYTHAILVWYGLIHFWNQFLKQPPSDCEVSVTQAAQKLAEARFGFDNSVSVLENLGHNREYLISEYQSEIERIDLSIKSDVGNYDQVI